MLLKSWYRGTEAYYSLNPPHRLMEQEEDYSAPFGMSQIDFNSMIRRRNLANLDRQLVEQGRVTLPGTLTVPSSNTARLVDVEHDAANAPEPLVADAEEAARPCSSVYSRDIDEGSPSFGTFFRQTHFSAHHFPKPVSNSLALAFAQEQHPCILVRLLPNIHIIEGNEPRHLLLRNSSTRTRILAASNPSFRQDTTHVCRRAETPTQLPTNHIIDSKERRHLLLRNRSAKGRISFT